MAIKQKTAIGLVVLPFFLLGFCNSFYLPYLYELNVAYYWVADVTQFVFVPGISLFLLFRGSSLSFSECGFKWPKKRSMWLLLFFNTLLLILIYGPMLNYLKTLALGLLPYSRQLFTFHAVVPDELPWRVVVVFYFAVTAGLVEETFYRGLLFAYWKNCITPLRLFLSYSLSSALLFSAIHWEYGLHFVFATFSIGILVAAMYYYSRNIWPFVISHALVDVVSFY